MARMTTSQSYMRCRGPGVRVPPGRAETLRHWPFLQLIAAACTFLQLWAVGREERGHFFAANFTSCHVIACICTYIHINFFSGMNHRGTILGCFGVLQRISGYSAYFSLRFFSKPLGGDMRRLKFEFEKLETPPRHLRSTELPAYSKVFQLIPTYYFF